MNKIDPTAIISPKAKLGKNIEIEPFAIIEDDVEIGDDCKIGPHAGIYNGARIGNRVKIFQSAVISNAPQDLKYAGEETNFIIGDDTTIREFVTLHRGTVETGVSKIGNNCLIMAYVHVAHDCYIGNNCIIGNVVQLAGHVTIADWVIIGGGSLIHQFEKIGEHSFIQGGLSVPHDIPPYVLAANDPIRYSGLNIVGLRRRGFSSDDITTIKEAYNVIYFSNLNLSDAKNELAVKFEGNKLVDKIIDFLNQSNRALLKK